MIMKDSIPVLTVYIVLLSMEAVISGQSHDISIGKGSTIRMNPDLSLDGKDSLSHSHPLADKKFGIGFNPVRTVVYIGSELQLRAAISLFSIDRHAEIAFPFQYNSGEDENIPYKVFYSEATYRRFINDLQKGFYFSGGIRYAYIEGEILDSSAKFGSPEEHTGIIYKKSKFGVYAGIGYRHFYKGGFYWGCNLIAGTYFGPRTPNIAMTEDLAYNFILGCDLLEIGFAF
jgi:hypothetical protein